MTQVGVSLVFVFTFILSTVADPVLATAKTQNVKARSPRVSSEFGYSIRNAEPSSSQYRQELRDTNGSIKGSYGFENPDGGYRFVHYVADDNGFRAHISSNEPGMGRQNPASVSINHSKQSQNPSSSSLEQRDVEAGLDPSRFELFSPIQRNTVVKDDWTPDPVEEYVRSKLGVRSHLFDTNPKAEPNPASLLAMYKSFAEKKAQLDRSQLTRAPTSSSYPSTFLDSNHLTSRRQTDEIRNYLQVLSNLERSRQSLSLPVSNYFRSPATPRTDLDILNQYQRNVPQPVLNSYIPRNHFQRDDSYFDLDSEEDRRQQDCNRNHLPQKDEAPSDSQTSLHRMLFGKENNNVLTPYDDFLPFYVPKSRKSDNTNRSPALVRFLEDEQNVENIRNILRTPQKSTYTKDSPRISLLGILILPSDILNGLGHKTESRPSDVDTDNPIMPSVHLGLDSSGSGAEDQPDPTDEGLSIDDKNKTSTVSDSDASNERYPTSTVLFQDKVNQLSDQSQPTSNKSDDFMKESRFLVFDDPAEGDTDDSGSSQKTSDSWRKMLEEEIRRDNESQFPLGLDIPDQRQLSLNEDDSPLYDSTGRPIKRENVPLHIHRLNLPPGMTSLPWKFSIPRPAPPRSVVIPPKPPVLS